MSHIIFDIQRLLFSIYHVVYTRQDLSTRQIALLLHGLLGVFGSHPAGVSKAYD